MEQKANIKFRT